MKVLIIPKTDLNMWTAPEYYYNGVNYKIEPVMKKETQIPPKMIRKINRWISPMPMDRETKKLMRMAAYYAYTLAVEYEDKMKSAAASELLKRLQSITSLSAINSGTLGKEVYEELGKCKSLIEKYKEPI